MLNLHKHSTQVESRHENSESGGIPILTEEGSGTLDRITLSLDDYTQPPLHSASMTPSLLNAPQPRTYGQFVQTPYICERFSDIH